MTQKNKLKKPNHSLIASYIDWKIVTIWEYPAIKEYVSWIKDRYKKNLYEGYEKLYIKIKKYEMQKKQATLNK